MSGIADSQASLEAVLKDEIIRMYQEVADQPEGMFHFYHGREAAELFGYEAEWLDRAPAGAVASFAGVGNPHERSQLQPGETVLDLGSGAGLDAIIASWQVGPGDRIGRIRPRSQVERFGSALPFKTGAAPPVPVAPWHTAHPFCT